MFKLSRFFLLGSLFGLTVMGSLRPGSAQETIRPDPALETAFRPFKTGWIGADGIYSIPLNQGRVLWLFGDTLLGKIAQGQRHDVKMIHNSLALQEGQDWEYFWNPPGQPDILKPPNPDTWFWPGPGVYWQGKLYIILPEFKHMQGQEAFSFAQSGTYLAIVDNATDPIQNWRWRYQRLNWGEAKQSYSVAALQKDGYFYVYGYGDRQEANQLQRDALLLRISLEQLAQENLTPQYWNGTDWTAQATQARPVFTGYQSEGSVHYNPSTQEYSLIYTAPGISRQVYQRLAPSPEGPWGEPSTVFEFPEMKTSSAFFCYAAKHHPHLRASDQELVLGYACNGLKFADVILNPHIYLPRFFRIRL